MKHSAIVAAAIVCAGTASAALQRDGHEHLGTVHFPVSCNAVAQRTFDRALALLHSFEFGQSLDGFNKTLEADPSCVMAYWGVALSQWGNPFAPGTKPARLVARGRDAIERARSATPATPRERDYIEAAARLFESPGEIPQPRRVANYRDAMRMLVATYPDDPEAATFYSLALAFAADPADKTYADQLDAGARLERLFAARPEHPGLAHYIIHTYDVPALASRSLEAARRYARIAPSAAHALHMPSHTFTRVGYWQESIDTNIASADIARRSGSTAEELHAADYQTYAYLQTGQDAAAKRLLDGLPAIAARFDPDAVTGAAPGSAGIFALAAIPARYALERGAWNEAVQLLPQTTSVPYADAMTHFARAIGAAHVSDARTANASVDALARIQARLAQSGEAYWAEQVEIQRRGAAAWLALAEKRHDEALDLMRSAASREDATEKSAVTPGPLAPARELLGEMLLELNRPAQALSEFEMVLEKEPNRFRAIAGAARAAAASGDAASNATYSALLVKICTRGDRPGRPALQEARRVAATGAKR